MRSSSSSSNSKSSSEETWLFLAFFLSVGLPPLAAEGLGPSSSVPDRSDSTMGAFRLARAFSKGTEDQRKMGVSRWYALVKGGTGQERRGRTDRPTG